MYILYFIHNNTRLTLCVSDDIDKLKNYPKCTVNWIDFSTDDETIFQGVLSPTGGWWLIESVKQL